MAYRVPAVGESAKLRGISGIQEIFPHIGRSDEGTRLFGMPAREALLEGCSWVR